MPLKRTRPGDGQRRRLIGGRIRATRIAAGTGLRQMARDLGMSASYFLGEPDYVIQRQRQLMSRPATRLDWQLMYDGEGERARAHFELDRVFQRLEEERGGRVERPAGGD